MHKKKPELTKITTLHYVRLVARSALFLAAAALYVIFWLRGTPEAFMTVARKPLLLNLIWAVFILEMTQRFFPSRLESMGCQKQFARNYHPVPDAPKPDKLPNEHRTVLVAAVWIAFNGIFWTLHLIGILDNGAMLLLCLAYSVCDMICILFFCPFQSWFLKNKCCGTCRIYNWDYAMMFTPLIMVPSFYSWSLVACSLALLLRWEITAHRHPERFLESSNTALRCGNCPEKLCHHKKQLHSFWQKNWAIIQSYGSVLPIKLDKKLKK